MLLFTSAQPALSAPTLSSTNLLLNAMKPVSLTSINSPMPAT